MWQSFDQMYGKRWTENFGNDPLGKYKDADGKQNPRMELWIDAVKYMSWPTLKLAIHRIASTPKPKDEVWWLPDLQSFKAFATGANNTLHKPAEQRRADITWVARVCNTYLFRIIAEHGPFSLSAMPLLAAEKNKVATAYEEQFISKGGDVPDEVTPQTREKCEEIRLEIRTMLQKKFSRLKIEPATLEELEYMHASLIPGNSNSRTPIGSSAADGQLNLD